MLQWAQRWVSTHPLRSSPVPCLLATPLPCADHAGSAWSAHGMVVWKEWGCLTAALALAAGVRRLGTRSWSDWRLLHWQRVWGGPMWTAGMVAGWDCGTWIQRIFSNHQRFASMTATGTSPGMVSQPDCSTIPLWWTPTMFCEWSLVVSAYHSDWLFLCSVYLHISHL